MGAAVRYAVTVRGRVQGVWFRQSCRHLAEQLGLCGWVANRADGTVAAEFEGAEEDVARAVSWCRRGPPAAEVEGIDVRQVLPSGGRGFAVR